MVAPGHARQPRTSHAGARRRGRLAVGVALALALTGAAACGGDDEEPTPGTTAAPTSPADTTTGGDGTGTSPEPGTAAPAGGDLPGEPFGFHPGADIPLGVVGVAADDTLNVRSGPGTEFDVVVELDPLADGMVATGNNRQLEDGDIWAELTTAGGQTGWANTAFLATPGAVEDVTSQLGELPTAETLVELADRVVELRVPGGPAPDVTVVVDPTVGDLGEITVDALGYGDDALAGERLHIFATPNPDGESFTTRTVEATYLCSRGVTADGSCV